MLALIAQTWVPGSSLHQSLYLKGWVELTDWLSLGHGTTLDGGGGVVT